MLFAHFNTRHYSVNMDSPTNIRKHSCHLCERSFKRKFHLKRHINTIHSEEKSTESDESSDMELKVPKPTLMYRKSQSESESESDTNTEVSEDSSESEEDDDDNIESEVELEDNPALQDWLELAKAGTDEMRADKYEKYVNEGMSEEEAKEKAYDKVLWKIKKNFFDLYAAFLWHHAHLENNESHKEI